MYVGLPESHTPISHPNICPERTVLFVELVVDCPIRVATGCDYSLLFAIQLHLALLTRVCPVAARSDE